MATVTRVVIVGGGPGGYEAALVAAQLGAQVTLADPAGVGGSAVLTDCVPSKTLVATAVTRTRAMAGLQLGLSPAASASDSSAAPSPSAPVDLRAVNARILELAAAQSADIAERLTAAGIRLMTGRARLSTGARAGIGQGSAAHQVVVADSAGSRSTLPADVVLVATGARPRAIPGHGGRPGLEPDGERILNWTQVYDLPEVPERLVVVGSGVTGAEFASAYTGLGSHVTLVSSRDRVLPGEDPDAATLLEGVFAARGLTVLSHSRAASVVRTAAGVLVTLTDGRTVEGSHCLLAVGSVPNTEQVGLQEAGVDLDGGGHIVVDRVSRTAVNGIYAAGDCTPVLPLASVAAMQGRIAMWHALGDAVRPLDLRQVSATIFTDPEIATVGGPTDPAAGGTTILLPLAGNPRAKMEGITEGFVKLYARSGSGTVTGAAIVAPHASELIHAASLAVAARLTVDQLAQAFTVYPSLSGSVAEAARRLHQHT
jgi:pyruvate/2-oxoglutarate dehydrogenase complex dihydrolipoamide dehydrogenase (E3) component